MMSIGQDYINIKENKFKPIIRFLLLINSLIIFVVNVQCTRSHLNKSTIENKQRMNLLLFKVSLKTMKGSQYFDEHWLKKQHLPIIFAI